MVHIFQMKLELILAIVVNWLQETYAVFAQAVWSDWITFFLTFFFTFGVLQSFRTFLRARNTIRDQIDAPKPTLEQVERLAFEKGRKPPFFIILIPALNEADVIINTINRLLQLDYPFERYAVLIITDEREKSDDGALTTHHIANKCADFVNSQCIMDWLHVVSVPEWYSGHFGSLERTYSRSTKGRALNYALQHIRADAHLAQADMFGVLDADGRMHPHVLREVAFKYLRDDSKVLQGPVFQISNYPHVALSGKAAGIELSIYHLSTLAYRLRNGRHRAEFLAGTNYFIQPELMFELGGWNEQALVEDAELGLRLFLERQIKPGWHSCHEIEQTPPDYKIYLKQRQRWALGHFQLLPMVCHARIPLVRKIGLSGRVLSGILKSPMDIALPIIGWLALFLGWTKGMPQWLGLVMTSLFLGSIFVWDFFGRGYRLLKKYAPVNQQPWDGHRIHQWKFILYMPWLILLQAQPRLVAFYMYLTGSSPKSWVKTTRTQEDPAITYCFFEKRDTYEQAFTYEQLKQLQENEHVQVRR
jgi:cellulose synthase/poly-beta-1,6-N-acetylglucosamine synthase-like glycosyltransferase